MAISFVGAILSVKDHEAESEVSASQAISGAVIEDAVADQDGEQDELFCRCFDPADGDIEDQAEEESEVQRPLQDPGMPTRWEILDHNVTHMPSRPWWPHCVKGKGNDTPSLRLSGSFAENVLRWLRSDYCFLTENEFV